MNNHDYQYPEAWKNSRPSDHAENIFVPLINRAIELLWEFMKPDYKTITERKENDSNKPNQKMA